MGEAGDLESALARRVTPAPSRPPDWRATAFRALSRATATELVNDDPSELAAAILERVARVLRSHQVLDFAFTGGVAVGVWAAPRQTKDLDLCGSLPVEEVDRLLSLQDGIRSGPEELPDIVRFRVEDWDVDLFVSKGPYDHECLRRAIPVEVAGVPVRVVTAEDLLIHKMIKLRNDRFSMASQPPKRPCGLSGSHKDSRHLLL